MTVPTSVAITSLPNNLATSSTIQLPTSCVSLVSTSTNGNQPLSIPISIRTTLAATNTQPQTTTMSWTTQGTPIQFAAQRPNGTISFMPQQATTVYQMPTDTIQIPQTMLITQPSSRPPDQSGTQTTTQLTGQTAGSIVQIIQTPNGPAQILSTSTASSSNLKQTTITVNNTSNLITSSTSSSATVNNSKQILPKGSKQTKSNSSSKSNSKANKSKNNNNTNNNSNNNTNNMTTLSVAPTINNLNNLNQLGPAPLMLNTGGQSTFFTSNGNLFFNQSLPLQTSMGQQQFIINSNQLNTNPNQTQNKTQQPNQTIIIPSSPANNQLKSQNIMQPVIQQQQTAPQLLQLPNGQMILVQPQQTSNDTLTLQNFNSPQPQFQIIPQQTNNLTTSDGQTMSYSTGGNQLVFTSQPNSFLNSSIVSNVLTTSTTASVTNSTTSSTTTTTTTSANKSKTTRKKPAAKKDNKNTLNKVETTNAQKSKGLNLADLLKEAGIMDSPPSSPITQTNTQELINTADQSLNTSTNTNSSTTQLSTMNVDQQTTLLNNSNNSSNNQPTMIVMPPNATNVVPGVPAGTNFFLGNPLGANTSTATQTVNNATTLNPPTQQAPQFKLAFAPDGSVILQTLPTFAQPLTTNNQLVQSNLNSNSKFVDASKDSLNSGSQPSPDSTTPTLDASSTPTSCSSLTVTTSTISFTTNQNTTTSTNISNSQLGPIKLSDSISLTVQQNNNGDNLNSNSNAKTPLMTIKSVSTPTASNKKTNNKGKKSANKKQQATKTDNNTINTQMQQPTQQLITIPIQATNLNSSINSSAVLSNPTNTVIQIGDNSLVKKSENQNILLLNSTPTNAVQTTTSTGLNQPQQVMQLSITNQDLLERIETQVKSLSAIKNPTQDQENLLQEFISLQKKMQAKNSGENSSLVVQQQQIGLDKLPNQTMITPVNKLTKDNPTNNSAPIITFNFKTIDQQGTKKLDQNINKQSTVLQSQPAQIFIQTSPTTANASNLSLNTSVNQSQIDPNSDGKKIKINITGNTNLTTAVNNQTTTAPQPGTTFQLGNQFFTITTPGKVPLQNLTTNQLNADGSSTQTVYQVVHLQPTPTNTLNSIDSKLIKLTDQNQLVTNNVVIKQEIDKKPKVNKFSFQQQLNADISAAAKPDCKTPFKNCNDACKRLLRYHVFHQPDLEEEKLDKFDEDFENLSEYLLYKKESLYRRFQLNILKQSMKTHSTAENIMLDKEFIEQEKTSLKEDKELVEKGDKLDLPEASFELKEKVRQIVDEELNNEEQERNKKRKSEELDSSTNANQTNYLKVKKTDNLAAGGTGVNESEDEEEDSESSVNEEESNDMHELNKYLDNLNEDMNQIGDLSPLYNNSNSYNSMMQPPQDSSSTFNQLFNQDWPTSSNETNKTVQDDQTGVVKSTSWVQEDAVAVESILDGEVVDQLSNHQPSNAYVDHHEHHLADEFNEADLLASSQSHQMNANIYDQKSSQLNMNSDSDTQMESAINSILDFITPSASNENGLVVGNDQLSSNGFNFNNNLTSNSQLSFSQNNSYSMPGINMNNRTNLINDYGNDQVLDEAVKSILS